MPDSTNFFEFVNNENPYAYLRNYNEHPFKKEHIKVKLDALQKMQPRFIPCIMDQGVLSNERTTTVNFVIRNGINENISKGVDILDRNNIEHDISQYKLVSQLGMIELNAKAVDLKDIGFDGNYVKQHKYNIGALNYIIETFHKYIDLEGMEDIILDMCRLKLINKQKILREKVFSAVQDKLDDEVIMGINLKKEIVEDSKAEARKLIELEKRFSGLLSGSIMLNATSTQTENKLYPLAALFIYANNQEVTKQKIISILKELGVNPQSKLAELFECDVIQMKNMLASASSASSGPATSAKVDTKVEETPEAVEEEIAEEVELDFGDLF